MRQPWDDTLAMEVKVVHYETVYGMSGDLRTLTHCEFAYLLCNLLNVAQFKLYREFLLIQESRNDPNWDEKSKEERIVKRPRDIFTVIRLDVDGRCDVNNFSSRAIALSRIQEQIDDICQGYPQKKIPCL